MSDLLIDLVSHYSPSRLESAAVRGLVDWMRAHDFAAYVDAAGNAVGVRGPDDARYTLILLGHIDTVPGEIPVQLDRFSQSPNIRGLKPTYSARDCRECGKCGKACSAGIIAEGTGEYISREDRSRCIGCMGCVRACPNGGRILKAGLLPRMMLGSLLKGASQQRLEPTVLLPV